MFKLTALFITSFMTVSALAATVKNGSKRRPTPEYEALSGEVQKLESRLKSLQRSLEEAGVESTESKNQIKSFLSDELSLGGFFESAMTGIYGPATPTQVSAATNTLGLNLAAELGEDFHFVSQILTTLNFTLANPNADPRAVAFGLPSTRRFTTPAFNSVPAQAYLEFTHNDALKTQFGLGYVPFGIALQQRELVLFVRRGGPQLMRTTDLVDPLWTGFNVTGSFRTGPNRLGYKFYSFTPITTPSVMGLGARTWWSSQDDSITAGISSQVANRSGVTYETLGADVRLSLGRFTVLSEYAQRFGPGEDPWSAYLEPNVAIYGRSWVIYTFVDYANSPSNFTVPQLLLDPYERIEYGFGVNWLPSHFTRFRLGFYQLDHLGSNAVIAGQDRDFSAIDFSIGVAF